VTVEPDGVERQWLAQLPADLGDEIVGDAQPRLRGIAGSGRCEGELFRSTFVSERSSFFSCAAMACFCTASACLRNTP